MMIPVCLPGDSHSLRLRSQEVVRVEPKRLRPRRAERVPVRLHRGARPGAARRRGQAGGRAPGRLRRVHRAGPRCRRHGGNVYTRTRTHTHTHTHRETDTSGIKVKQKLNKSEIN